jgi:iron complex transport system substrate-binding protein
MRVVTLLPSATETVCALGVDPVGVTHECDYPPRVRDLPTVVHSRIDTGGSSGDIDAAVQDATGDDAGVYELDAERLRDLDPDVVVTQGICDVCAVDETVVRETVADLGLDAELVATHPHTLGDVLDDVERIGAAVGRADEAAALREDLAARIDAVRERVAGRDRPTVTVLDWLDPFMVGGHWLPELVDTAGGEYVLADPGDRSAPIRHETLWDADPEVLVAAPCGFEIEDTVADLDELTGDPAFEASQAARDGEVYVVDGNRYVNCPSPMLVDTLERLAGVLHPEVFADPPRDGVRPLASLRGAV